MNIILKSSRLYIWQYVFIASIAISLIFEASWISHGLYVFISLSFLASAAFIHNDIVDKEVDKANGLDKLVHADEKTTKLAYLTTFAFLLGSIIISYIHSPELLVSTSCVAFLLYVYNVFARRILLVSSIISVIASLSPIWVIPLVIGESIHDIFPLLSSAFLLLLAREWIFDARDVKGDRIANRITLATIFGSKNTIQYSLVLMVFSFAIGFYWIFETYGVAMVTLAIMGYLAFNFGKNYKQYTDNDVVDAVSVKPLIHASYTLMLLPMLLVIFLNTNII